MSLGQVILLLFVMYYVVKSAVKNGIKEYLADMEAKKSEFGENEEEQL